MVCHLRSSLANVTIERGIVLHEMCGRQAHLRAVKQHIDVLIRTMFTTRLPASVGCMHTDGVTVKAIINTLLDLNLTH
jgi:hypothetical protein